MASFLLQVGGPIIGSIALERVWLRGQCPWLYSGSLVPKAYSGVIAVNVVTSSVVVIMLGFKVSAARSKYRELAKEKGDVDAEERYSYPKMYAEGFTEEAKQFNCVQRGHQQILETYSQFLVLSLVGGLGYPVTSTLGGLLWVYARLKWAEGYATGDPKNRYGHWASRWIWYGLATVLFTSSAVAVDLVIS
eukprot:gene18630-24365_t